MRLQNYKKECKKGIPLPKMITWCLEGSTPSVSPHKKKSLPLFLDLPYDDFKIPSPYLFAPPSPINITTMTRHHAQFSPTSSPPKTNPFVRLLTCPRDQTSSPSLP